MFICLVFVFLPEIKAGENLPLLCFLVALGIRAQHFLAAKETGATVAVLVAQIANAKRYYKRPMAGHHGAMQTRDPNLGHKFCLTLPLALCCAGPEATRAACRC